LFARRDRDHEDFRFVFDHARNRKSADFAGAAALARHMANHIAVREQPLEFILAPAVGKRTRMNARKCCGVARTRIQDRRFGPPEQGADRADHCRGSR
jgi:hypothetical protein